MIIAEIKGNLLDTEIKTIAHGVNCQDVMGSGVAKAIYTKYPEVKEDYHNCAGNTLGEVDEICTNGYHTIYNCWTQFYYGRKNIRYVNYFAICQCFREMIKDGVQEVAIPRIGCGLAGGDWDIVRELINDATEYELDVTVYYL